MWFMFSERIPDILNCFSKVRTYLSQLYCSFVFSKKITVKTLRFSLAGSCSNLTPNLLFTTKQQNNKDKFNDSFSLWSKEILPQGYFWSRQNKKFRLVRLVQHFPRSRRFQIVMLIYSTFFSSSSCFSEKAVQKFLTNNKNALVRRLKKQRENEALINEQSSGNLENF